MLSGAPDRKVGTHGSKDVIVFESSDGDAFPPAWAKARNNKAWFNRKQLAPLYSCNVKTIRQTHQQHPEGRIPWQDGAVVANFATTAEGGRPVRSSKSPQTAILSKGIQKC